MSNKRKAEKIKQKLKERISEKQYKACHEIIHAAAGAAGVAGGGFAQIPLSDAALITPAQITMIIALGKVFDQEITKTAAGAIAETAFTAIVGRGVSQVLVGWIPGLGNAINVSTAVALTEAIGWMAANKFAEETTKGTGTSVRDVAAHIAALEKKAQPYLQHIKSHKDPEYDELLSEISKLRNSLGDQSSSEKGRLDNLYQRLCAL